MEKKKFAIVTSADSNSGDFLINHWLKSLTRNLKKEFFDIVILDYGLTDKQKKLIPSTVIIVNCIKDGSISNIRYRDLLNFLEKNFYEQILFCDGGDLIFQRDITELFFKNKDHFRVVCEDIEPFTIYYAVFKKAFDKRFNKKITKFLCNKKTINGGFIIGPYNKFKHLCKKMNLLIKDKKVFGVDQVILNYVLHNEGFIEIDKKYNFIPTTTLRKFKIRNGVFLDKNNEVIAVIHNAGYKSAFRPIKNFGYGREYNNINFLAFFLIRNLFKLTTTLKKRKLF